MTEGARLVSDNDKCSQSSPERKYEKVPASRQSQLRPRNAVYDHEARCSRRPLPRTPRPNQAAPQREPTTPFTIRAVQNWNSLHLDLLATLMCAQAPRPTPGLLEIRQSRHRDVRPGPGYRGTAGTWSPQLVPHLRQQCCRRRNLVVLYVQVAVQIEDGAVSLPDMTNNNIMQCQCAVRCTWRCGFLLCWSGLFWTAAPAPQPRQVRCTVRAPGDIGAVHLLIGDALLCICRSVCVCAYALCIGFLKQADVQQSVLDAEALRCLIHVGERKRRRRREAEKAKPRKPGRLHFGLPHVPADDPDPATHRSHPILDDGLAADVPAGLLVDGGQGLLQRALREDERREELRPINT